MMRIVTTPIAIPSRLSLGRLVGWMAVLIGVDGLSFAGEPNGNPIPAKENEWIALFDGKSLSGWATDEGEPVTRGWAVEDGMIVRTGRGGYMVTERQFADFELVFEWKLDRGTNSGIKYRVKDYGDHSLGCEYQIIDDGGYRHPLAPWQRTAALYAVHAPPRAVKPNRAGQWNSGRVFARSSHIEHWLNGKKTVDADTTSDDWKRRVEASKFIDYADFGQNLRGPIKIQDHGGKIWFRRIDIRVLK